MTYEIVPVIICANLRFIIHYDTPSKPIRLMCGLLILKHLRNKKLRKTSRTEECAEICFLRDG